MDEEYNPTTDGFKIDQEIIHIDILQFHANPINISSHHENKVITKIIDKTMFGMTFLKGPENLSCLSFTHILKDISSIRQNKRVGTEENDDIEKPIESDVSKNEQFK